MISKIQVLGSLFFSLSLREVTIDEILHARDYMNMHLI